MSIITFFFNDKIIIVIYVNDLFIIEFNRKFIDQIKQILKARFQITNVESLIYYLNINIERDKRQRTFYFN